MPSASRSIRSNGRIGESDIKYILLKTLRDIRETIGSFISILIVIFVGCFFFAGVAEGSSSTTERVEDYYAACNLSYARAEYMYVNSAAVDEIAGRDGVKAAAGYDTFYTKTKFDGIRYDLSLTTLTPGIDDPYMLEGRLPDKDAGEIIIDGVFADAHGAKIGDTLEFDINTLDKISLITDEKNTKYDPMYKTETYSFKICGIYHSPDTIYKVNMMNTSAQPDEFVMAYVNYGEIKSYTDTASVVMPITMNTPAGEMTVEHTLLKYSDLTVDVFNGIKFISDGKNLDTEKLFKECSITDDASRVEEELMNMFENPDDAAGLFMYSLERENFPSVLAFNGINDTIASLAAVLPFIFFAVAAAITIISLSKTVDNHRMQIGVIQALGISKGAVYFSYIFYALFACFVGGLTGGLVGTFFVPYLLDIIYSGQFAMPPVAGKIKGLFLVLGVVISSALACLSAFVSCNRTLKANPAQAMRPKPPKKTKRILAERWTGLWSKLGFGAKMNLRNMFLHKMRMLLSSVGIIGCLALLIGLVGLKDNMQFSFKSYDGSVGYDMTIISDIAVDITDESVYDVIAENEGAAYMHTLTFVPDFSGRFEFNGKTADLTVMALPTYADEKFYRYADADCIKLYTDVDGKDRMLFESDTFVIPEMLADKLGAKAGDTVKVSGYSLDNRSVEFEIVVSAVVCEYFEQKAYCSYDVFKNNGVGLLADTSYATLLPGVSMDTARQSLDKNEAVRDVKSFEETFEALEKKMSLLDYAVILFVVGAAVLAIAVIYNITATNLKERTREIATLMVLGYRPHETASMIVVENLVITALGCIIGLPLGYGLLVWLVSITTSFNVYISGFFSWYVALGCIGLTFVFSLIATLLLNSRMKNISMVEALKSVE